MDQNETETALRTAWDFLEKWTDTLSRAGAGDRLPAFLAEAETLRERMPQGIFPGRP